MAHDMLIPAVESDSQKDRYRYRAFISYSHTDGRSAEKLHRSLETFVVPKALAGRETEAGPVPARLFPIFRDRDELSAGPDLDAVIVATPDFWHAEHAIAAMKAGLQVYCEKEMSNTLADARRMVQTSRETG